MKLRNFLAASLLLCAFTSQGQVLVNGFDINKDSTIQYIEVSEKRFQSTLFAIVDYGQRELVSIKHDGAIINESGQPISFESMAGVLNYLYKNGWQLVASNTVISRSSSSTSYNNATTYYDAAVRYLLERRKQINRSESQFRSGR